MNEGGAALTISVGTWWVVFHDGLHLGLDVLLRGRVVGVAVNYMLLARDYPKDAMSIRLF